MLYDELLVDLQSKFSAIVDTRRKYNQKYSLKNVLLSGFALFSLKDSSLLSYIQQYPTRKANLKSIFGISQCPSDSGLRTILDEVEPSSLQEILPSYIQLLDKNEHLDAFLLDFGSKKANLDGFLLIPIDGVQYFSSSSVHCGCCLEKKFKNGSTTYHHNALSAVIVHPDLPQVLVVASEEIKKQDGQKKNDHELVAATRLIPIIKQAIGDRKAIIGGDSLFANAPFIRLLLDEQLHFLFSIKEGYQGYPFIQFNQLSKDRKTKIWIQKDKTHQYHYEFANNLVLNGQNQDIKVNFVRFKETNLKTGETLTMEWITNIPLSIDNINAVVKAGRARWKIENETFNTLKNQGYHYDHNFGHGKKYLAQNLAQLMLIAFMFDQMQHLLSPLFNKALVICKSKKMLWLKLREIVDLIPVKTMESIYKIITKEIKLKIEIII
jgi:Transposase DDE domain